MAINLIDSGILSTQSHPPLEPSARRVPGYALFLASIYLVLGPDVQAVTLIQCLALVPAICVLSYCIFRRAKAGQTLAMVASLLVGISPTTVTMANKLNSEVLLTVLILGVTFCAYLWCEHKKMRYAVGVGLLSGLAALVKPEALLLLTFVGPVVLLTSEAWKKIAVQSPVAILTLALVISPWIYRNVTVLGIASIQKGTAAEGEASFKRVYRLRAENGFLLEPERHQYFYDDPIKSQAEFEHALTLAVQNPEVSDNRFWISNPLLFAKYSLARLYDTLRPASWSEVFGLDGDFGQYRRRGDWLQLGFKLALLILDFMIVTLGLLGVCHGLRRSNAHVWIMISVVIYFLFIYSMLHGVVRYRVPIMPLLTLLGVWFVSHVYGSFFKPRAPHMASGNAS